jgi:lipopolysaccharide transport system ATP-binding protein
MSHYALRVEHISKKYQLRHQDDQHRYLALRDVIAGSAKKATERLLGRARQKSRNVEDFWALNDVTFDVKPGEVVGIIGRNGAGKSTLLKILSRITEPSTGRVRIRGRIASLLEVGTGFHPELTGRENIFLNGAILGMTRAEIRRRFDEIVAFAEVEKFLDTPVKRYSSGMYVRLAFAVAAHLEPEVLVVDEVLAVGDVAFQMKCLGKMKDVSVGGRTILYVSHNLSSITNLCDRGILLNRGRVVFDGSTDKAVNGYLQLAVDKTSSEPHILYENPRPRGDAYQVRRVEMLDNYGQPKSILRPMDFVKLRVWFNTTARVPQGSIVFELLSAHGSVVLKLETNPSKFQPLNQEPGLSVVDCDIAVLPLLEGQYILGVGLAICGVSMLTWIPDAANLLVVEPVLGTGADMSIERKGIIVVDHEWGFGTSEREGSLSPA